MTTQQGGLTIAIDGGIATVTMNYPMFNPLGIAMVGDLAAVLPSLASDDGVRVVVLQSGVPGVFCIHGDAVMVTDMMKQGAEAIRQGITQLHEVFKLLATMPQVTIAKIAGLCRGGGNELALACDLRYAATGITRLGQPEVALGLIPGAGGAVRLTRMLGRARAMEVVVGGADYTAEEAARMGWLNRAVPERELDACVAEIAARIADYPGYAIAAVKRVINKTAGFPDFVPETDDFVEVMLHPETLPLLEESFTYGFCSSLEAEQDVPRLLEKARKTYREKKAAH